MDTGGGGGGEGTLAMPPRLVKIDVNQIWLLIFYVSWLPIVKVSESSTGNATCKVAHVHLLKHQSEDSVWVILLH